MLNASQNEPERAARPNCSQLASLGFGYINFGTGNDRSESRIGGVLWKNSPVDACYFEIGAEHSQEVVALPHSPELRELHCGALYVSGAQ